MELAHQQKAAMQIINNEKNPLLNSADQKYNNESDKKNPNCTKCLNEMNTINSIVEYKQDYVCSKCDYISYNRNTIKNNNNILPNDEFFYECLECNFYLCASCGRYSNTINYPNIKTSNKMKLECYHNNCNGNDEPIPENKWFKCDGCGYCGYTNKDICGRFICKLHITDDNPYALCEECRYHRLYLQLQSYDNNKIFNEYDIHNLYYIFIDGKNTGPYSLNDLKKMYVKKELGHTADKLYIICADGVYDYNNKSFPDMETSIYYDVKWVPIVFPSFNILNTSNINRCKLLKRLESENYRLSKQYTNIYNGLIIPVLYGTLRQVELPKDIPFDIKYKTQKWYLYIIQLIGRIIALLLTFVIIINCIPTSIVWFINICFSICNRNKKKNNKIYQQLIVFIGAYSGMIITPFIISGIILQFEWYNIKPWMMAYIIWGISSYFITITYRISLFMNKNVDTINNIIFFLTGIEFSEFFDIEKEIKYSNVVTVIFPSLGSLFFAVIGWYISDFMITERFTLDCNEFENIENDDFCVETAHGCCKIISSQNINKSFQFIAALGGASVSTWAFIRFVGYALVNKYPKLAMFAKPPS